MGKFGSVSGATDVDGACPEKCPAGSYCPGGNNVVGCPAGRFGSEMGSQNVSTGCPYVCMPGTYGNLAGTSTFEAACPSTCRAGRYGNKTGATSEADGCPFVCPSGRFGNLRAQTTLLSACPSLCPAGRYGQLEMQTSISGCNKCETGYYCEGATHRQKCNPGKYGDSIQQTNVLSCKTCEAGFFCEGGFARRECPAGSYGEKVEQSSIASCIDCEKGYYCSGSRKLPCPPGKYGNKGQQASLLSCKLCEIGYVCAGRDSHLPCTAGKFGDQVGKLTLESCKSCPKGYYCSGADSKVPCRAGKYGNQTFQSSESSCKTCERGYFCDGGKRRVGCPLGKYSVYENVDSECKCDRCPAGKYGDKIGALNCKFCPPGKTNDAPGYTSIISCYDLIGCPAGKAYNALAQACELCRVDFYNPSFIPAIGRMETTKTVNRFLNGSSGNYVSYEVFSSKLRTILINENELLSNRELVYLFDRIDVDGNSKLTDLELSTFNDGCLQCPRYGAICSGKGTKIPLMRVGFWREDPSHPDVEKYPYYKCLRKNSCPGGNGSLGCSTGYETGSAACSYCTDNYVLQNNQCNFCHGKETIGSLYAIIIFFILLLIMVFIAWNVMTQPHFTRADIEKLQEILKRQKIIDLQEDVTPKRMKKKRSSIDFGQIKKLVRKASNYSNDEVKELFQRMDISKTHEISREEIEQFVGLVDEILVEVPHMRGIYVTESHDGSIVVKLTEGTNRKIILKNDKILSLNGKQCSSMKQYEKFKNECLDSKKPIKLRIVRPKSSLDPKIEVKTKYAVPAPPLDSWNDVATDEIACDYSSDDSNCDIDNLSLMHSIENLKKHIYEAKDIKLVQQEFSAYTSQNIKKEKCVTKYETETERSIFLFTRCAKWCKSGARPMAEREKIEEWNSFLDYIQYEPKYTYLDDNYERVNVAHLREGKRIRSHTNQRVKILFDHMQVMCFLDIAFNIPWPEAWIQFSNTIRIFSLDVLDVLGIASCHITANFETLFYLHMMLVPLLVVVLAFARWLAICYKNRQKKPRFTNKVVQKRMYSLFQIMLFILYTGICTRITRVFKCIEIQDKWWLEADMEMECFVGSHTLMTSVAILCAMIYILGIPLFQFLILYYNRNRLEERDVRQMWGSIYQEYKQKFWYFELVAMIRRFLLTAFMVFISSEDAIPQIVISMIVGLIWYTMLLKWEPYKDKDSAWVGELLGVQMILNLLLMLALLGWSKSEEIVTGQEFYNRTAFDIFLVGTNATCAQTSPIFQESLEAIAIQYPEETKKKLRAENMSRKYEAFLAMCTQKASASEVHELRTKLEAIDKMKEIIEIENIQNQKQIEELEKKNNKLREKYIDLEENVQNENFADAGRLKKVFGEEIEKRTDAIKQEIEANKEEQRELKLEQAKINEMQLLKNKKVEEELKKQASELESQKMLRTELEDFIEKQTNAILNELERVGKDESDDSGSNETLEERLLETIAQLQSDSKIFQKTMEQKRRKHKERIERIREERREANNITLKRET
eukprot:g14324.t1